MSETLTPMMRQYHAIRKDLPPDTLLLFRLGDFYEMFFEDARIASSLLNVALTRRGEMPMCGVPFHAAKGYIAKLIAAGKRVALCDQIGEVQQGKLVRREITQILSPGTLDDIGLEAARPNYIAALRLLKGVYGLAYADLSTGEFRLTQLPSFPQLLDEMVRISPSEIIAPLSQRDPFSSISGVTWVEGYSFESEPAELLLKERLHVASLDGFGCAGMSAAIGAAGGLLHFLIHELRRDVSHVRKLGLYQTTDYVVLDAATQSHLELVQARSNHSTTLTSSIDRTVTPMGKRLLREWVLHPLCNVEEICNRQDAVALLLNAPMHLDRLRQSLSEIRDLERSLSRLSQNSGTARDLIALGGSLAQLPGSIAILAQLEQTSSEGSLISSIKKLICPLPELSTTLTSAIVQDPPAVLREGGMICDGYDTVLDELRAASREGKSWIANLQEQEIARTGIKSLKIRYNLVFGYFIEITKSNLSLVPSDYIRKQTTTSGERFITSELKEIEGRILGSEEKAKALEFEIFQRLRAEALSHLADIQQSANALAILDALASFAETGRLYSYCRPQIDKSGLLHIEEGRHPVLDQRASEEAFVANDVQLDSDGARFAIITGPNMAGKSTYIRQVALLVLLAQTGAFLPAKSAHIGVVDRIFTRVGANDDLTRGQSTFMVEMTETANILNNATPQSLIILDEIGRGTSTFDGLSIAWSVAEYLHDRVGARTLFATHYHELTDLENRRSGVRNFNVSVREWNDEIIFLRKIVPGRADQSYGIQVARLAGLPDSVLRRAKEILANLEKLELNAEGKPSLVAGIRRRAIAAADSQLDLL
ncbi:MAG: DNA mismatch repair protein MutS [Verrucomicrobia bacterium]|nr:MAG: DNA mismatch repair protein MutS [Verrucomicrobiota bacterium]